MEKDEQRINVLILSDIHFGREKFCKRSETLGDQRKICLKKLIVKLSEIQKDYPIKMVIIVGDIAFSGSKDEYDEAEKWIRDLFTILGLEPEKNLVICPGNHDIKQYNTSIHDTKYPPKYTIADECLDLKNIPYLSKRYSKYEEFIENLGILFTDLNSKDSVFKKKTSKLNTKLIMFKKIEGLQIIALNSTWFSRNSDYDSGRMAVGLPFIYRLKTNEVIVENEKKLPPFSIICFHHPFDHLWDKEKDALKNELAECAHLILTGHLHNEDPAIKIRENDDFYDLQCGATYSQYEYKNHCHLLQLDTGSNDFWLVPLSWNKTKWIFDEKKKFKRKYKVSANKKEKIGPEFTSEFEKPLEV